MPFIGALLAGLSRLLFSRVGQWGIQLLLALGIGFATKEFALDPLMSYVESAFAGLPSIVVEWVGHLNIDIYCVGVLSAYAAAAVKNVVLRKLSPA